MPMISQELRTVKKKKTAALFSASFIRPTSFSSLLSEIFCEFFLAVAGIDLFSTTFSQQIIGNQNVQQ